MPKAENHIGDGNGLPSGWNIQSVQPHNGTLGRADADLQAYMREVLAFQRAVFRHRQLSLFSRNATTWEALLLIACAQGDEGPGLYELVAAVQTNALGKSALLRFLRDRRDDGSIVFSRSRHKQSKWTLALREDLRVDLMDLLRQRAADSVLQRAPFQEHYTR